MIEEFAASVTVACQKLSASRLVMLLPERLRAQAKECYVIGFAATLTVLLNYTLGPVPAVVAAYRVLDIVSYRLYYLLVKSKTTPWQRSDARRSLLLVLANAYELIVAFGIMYMSSGSVRNATGTLSDPMSAAYFSMVTMTTVGYGDFVPSNTLGRAIVCTQLCSELILLMFIVPTLLGLLMPGAADDKG